MTDEMHIVQRSPEEAADRVRALTSKIVARDAVKYALDGLRAARQGYAQAIGQLHDDPATQRHLAESLVDVIDLEATTRSRAAELDQSVAELERDV